jgi:hypothetical protein
LRLICTVLLFSLFSGCTIPSFGKSRASGAPVDQDYVLALATADHFLHAWQTQDEEAGLLMLTDRIRQRTSEDLVRSFFSSPTNPRTSYEIGHGKKLASGRYEFPVALYQPSPRNGHKWMLPLTSTLIVVRSGKSEWAIDNLP